MASPIQDIDKGWKRIETEIRQRDTRRVTVGVHDSKANRPDAPPNNVELATIHEFGATITRGGKTYKIPERSFIRATVDKNQAKYARLAATLAKKVLDGEFETERALALLGEAVKADIIRAINAGLEPGLAPSTIAAKGSSKPLIDTGALKQAITYEVVNIAKRVMP